MFDAEAGEEDCVGGGDQSPGWNMDDGLAAESEWLQEDVGKYRSSPRSPRQVARSPESCKVSTVGGVIEPRTDASQARPLVPAPPTQRAVAQSDALDFEDIDEVLDLACGAGQARASKRRCIKGARGSSTTFTGMFQTMVDFADISTSLAVKEILPDEDSILQHSRRLRRSVREHDPTWEPRLVRLATGALAVYRLRLIDMWRKENALLLWIIEGEDFLRAHDGAAYLYHNDGAFCCLQKNSA